MVSMVARARADQAHSTALQHTACPMPIHVGWAKGARRGLYRSAQVIRHGPYFGGICNERNVDTLDALQRADELRHGKHIDWVGT